MSNSMLANQILAGSRNLDRMKKDVYDLCTMILGLTRYTQVSWEKGEEWTFESDTCTWKLFVREYGGPKMFGLLCMTRVPIVSSAFSINWNSIELSPDQVQMVYDDLDTFVKGMIKEFPRLEELLAPFTRAGK